MNDVLSLNALDLFLSFCRDDVSGKLHQLIAQINKNKIPVESSLTLLDVIKLYCSIGGNNSYK